MAAGTATGTAERTGLYLVLGLAAVVGIVGGLLLAGAPVPPTPKAGEVVVDLPAWAWGLLFLLPFFACVAGVLAQRARSDSSTSRRGLIVVLVVLVATVVVLGVLLAYAHPGSQGSVTYRSPTSPTPPASNHSGSTGGGGSSGGPAAGVSQLTINGWEILAVALGLVGLVLLLTFPGVLSRVVDRRRPTEARVANPGEVRAAVADAESAIGRGEDPRETVVRLYLRLLEVLEPRVGTTDCLTAGEIRHGVLERLGVRAPAARELTQLFEEARYSTHPMGPAEAARCRTILAAVQTDLSRSLAS